MSFQYKNPTSSILVNAPNSVSRNSDTGTIFSVNSVGGYMEVYNLSDLDWVIPNDILINGGPVLYSGNSIPISFVYNTPYSLPNTLNMNNDGISSGRRRLGMQVHVQESDTVYQFTITGFTALWNAAEAVGSIVDLIGGYEVYDDTPEGVAFLNAWTGSTIEGQSGTTKENARWRIFYGTDVQITGGTYDSQNTELSLNNSTGGTITITGFAPAVTGGTYNSGTQELTLYTTDNNDVVISGFTSGGGSPLTVYDATSGVTATNVTGMTFSGASVVNNGGGNVLISITGGTSGVIVSGSGVNSSVRCGVSNTASGNYSASLGGRCNISCGNCSTISGGFSNIVYCNSSTIGGGFCNVASGATSTIGGGQQNRTYASCSTIGGGIQNTACGSSSTVGGGNFNFACCNCSTISGGYYNIASGTSSTISGGYCNFIFGNCSTIGGGIRNTACNLTSTISGGLGGQAMCAYSTIGGGFCNIASGSTSTIGGGFQNRVYGSCSTISGGINNTICNAISTIGGGNLNRACCLASTIGGGCSNTTSGDTSTIGGGRSNCTLDCFTTIGGGWLNKVTGLHSTIGGGFCNTISSTYAGSSTIGGGNSNFVSGYTSTIGGGSFNTASNSYSTVGGGGCNIASGSISTVIGGFCNTASGLYSTVIGGQCNAAISSYSFVGGQCNIAGGSHSAVGGCGLTNSCINTFMYNCLRAFNLSGSTVAVCVGTDGILVRGASDVRLKTCISPITYGLSDVLQLNPVSFNWCENIRESRGENRQLGFIAQEVEPIIPESVGMSAEGEYSFSPDKIIPVLTKAIQELKEENNKLREENINIKIRIEKLEEYIR
jgi:hypothetical protein